MSEQDQRVTESSDHEIEPLYVPICEGCGRAIEYDEDSQTWRHIGR